MDPGDLVTEPLVVEPATGADIRAEAAEAEAVPRMSATASCAHIQAILNSKDPDNWDWEDTAKDGVNEALK